MKPLCRVSRPPYPSRRRRVDGARITGPQIAWNKAFTAAGHKRSTHLFNQMPNGPALPRNEAFGIQWSFEGRFAVFVGGFPIVVEEGGRRHRFERRQWRAGHGLRYRVNRRPEPSLRRTADIVFPREKVAIFVNWQLIHCKN